jgi:hypothetical protein
MTMNRETWLNQIAVKMAPRFAEMGHPLPSFRVAVGWPSAGKDAPVSGECWNKTISADGHFEIFLNPGRADSMLVAATFAHELIHAAVGLDQGHKGDFAKMALAMGFARPLTQASAVTPKPLVDWIQPMIDELGPLPHAAINYSRGGSMRVRRTASGVNPIIPKAALADDGEGASVGGDGDEEAPANNRPPTQSTRLLKVACGECGYTVRVTSKWLEKGAPGCPDHGPMKEAA